MTKSIGFIPEVIEVKRRVMDTLGRFFRNPDGLTEAERPAESPKHVGVYLDKDRPFTCREKPCVVYRQPNGRFASHEQYLDSRLELERVAKLLRSQRW
jgi:hypothetical protein